MKEANLLYLVLCVLFTILCGYFAISGWGEDNERKITISIVFGVLSTVFYFMFF